MAALRQIAFYGKGGIGKSTTSQNTLAALAEMGQKILIVGCDPKADSTKNLVGGKRITTVLDQMKAKGDALTLGDITFKGFHGCICTEAGGPTPGIGCAGRGIITAFEQLEQLQALRVDCAQGYVFQRPVPVGDFFGMPA